MIDELEIRHWSSGKRLFRLRAAGVHLSEKAMSHLDNVTRRHPDWNFDPTERSEFSVWTGTTIGDKGDPSALSGISIDKIVPLARAKAQADRYAYGGLWRNFTQLNPVRAFEALVDRASQGDIQNDEWQQLFFKLREETSNQQLDARVLAFLCEQKLSAFDESYQAIVSWLKDKRSSLESLSNGWVRVLAVWDQIANDVQDEFKDTELDNEIDDIIMAVLNDTPGILVELLVQRLGDLNLVQNSHMPEDLGFRLEMAMNWPGAKGLIAQAALMQHLPWLEYLVPNWTWEHLVPLLSTGQKNSNQLWQARFYHSSLGTQKLFEETKEAFLATFATFGQSSDHEREAFLLVRAAYQATRKTSVWDFTPSEARSAVASSGSSLMISIGRILRHRSDKDSAKKHWRTVVFPILDFLWPRDATLQTKETSRSLIRLFFDAEDCFPDAVDSFVHFIRPWDPEKPWEFNYLFDEHAVSLLSRYPRQAIELLSATVAGNTVPVKLNEILDQLEVENPDYTNDPDFLSLRGLARRSAA